MKANHDSGNFNGVIFIAEKDKVLYSKGFGFSDREEEIPNDPSHVFPIMFLTKQFTAAILLQLAEEGKLNLEDPFVLHLPEYRQNNWQGITLHHLMSQTSGLPDYIQFLKLFDGNGVEGQYHSPDTLMSKVIDKPLEFIPGEKFDYSNTNYTLLGLVIERVTNKPLVEAVAHYITDPLQLKYTGYNIKKLWQTQPTGSYYLQDGKWTPSPKIDLSLAFAGGGMYSNMGDLYKFQHALDQGRILQSASLKMMYQPYALVDEQFIKQYTGYENTQYGYGLFIKKISNGTTSSNFAIMAPGGLPFSFSNHFIRLPEKGIYIITMENSGQYFFPGDIISILTGKSKNHSK